MTVWAESGGNKHSEKDAVKMVETTGTTQRRDITKKAKKANRGVERRNTRLKEMYGEGIFSR